MKRWIRNTLSAAGALAVALAAALGAAYVATPAGAPVPRTVVDDPALPSATIDGVRLHVRTHGDPSRPTVVVLHGGPGGDFRSILPLAALADAYHVVFYDQRGSGLSERVPDARLTLDGFYRELDGVVDRFGGGRPVALVGFSWGAMLASGYLGRHPEKVAAVVLAEPGMLTAEAARRFMAATNGMRPPLGIGVARALGGAWLRSLHVGGPDDDARRDALFGGVMHADFPGHPMAGYFCGRDVRTGRFEDWRSGARASAALLAEARGADGAMQVDFVRGVDRWPGTVLFLAGSCDAVVGEAQQRLHMASFPRADLAVVDGAGHTLFGEKPVESVAVVRRYLDAAPTLARAP